MDPEYYEQVSHHYLWVRSSGYHHSVVGGYWGCFLPPFSSFPSGLSPLAFDSTKNLRHEVGPPFILWDLPILLNESSKLGACWSCESCRSLGARCGLGSNPISHGCKPSDWAIPLGKAGTLWSLRHAQDCPQLLHTPAYTLRLGNNFFRRKDYNGCSLVHRNLDDEVKYI